MCELQASQEFPENCNGEGEWTLPMIATILVGVLFYVAAWKGMEGTGRGRIVWMGFLVVGWLTFLWAAGVWR